MTPMHRMLQAIVIVTSLALPAAPSMAADERWLDLGRSGQLAMDHPPECILKNPREADKICQLVEIPKNSASADLVQSYTRRASMLLWLGRMDAAAAEIDAARHVVPNSAALRHLAARIAFHEAILLGRMPRMADAQSHIEAALALAPQDIDVNITRVQILARQGRKDTAMKEAEKLAASHPTYADAWSLIGEIALNFAQPERAIPAFERVVALGAPEARVFGALAQLYIETGDAAKAADRVDKAIALDAGRIEYYLVRARANRSLGRSAALIADLNVLIDGPRPGVRFALSPQQIAAFLTQRAHAHFEMQRDKQASDDIVRALDAGGLQTLLQMQLHLRRNGLKVAITRERTEELNVAIRKCFAQAACRAEIGTSL